MKLQQDDGALLTFQGLTSLAELGGSLAAAALAEVCGVQPLGQSAG